MKLNSPRLITDVDFYMWLSGYDKRWTCIMRTFKFYCRLSLLVTFEWLLAKHLHKELGVDQWETAAASPCAAWAWPRPMQKGRGSHPTTVHFCLPSAGVAKQLPSLTVLFLPFPCSSLTCSLDLLQPQSFSFSLHALEWGQGRGSGGGVSALPSWKRAVSYGCVLGIGVNCHYPFFPLITELLVECSEVCFLISLWQMFEYPEWKCAIWISRSFIGGEGREKGVRWEQGSKIRRNDSFIQISFLFNSTR